MKMLIFVVISAEFLHCYVTESLSLQRLRISMIDDAKLRKNNDLNSLNNLDHEFTINNQ